MVKLSILALFVFLLVHAFRPAHAQLGSAPIPSALPGVAKISLANAAGVLNYCSKNNLASSAAADQVMGTLTKKPDASSADYKAGMSGNVMGDNGKSFSIASAPSYLQSQICDMVLQQAKTFK
jgi:hypothetical protein